MRERFFDQKSEKGVINNWSRLPSFVAYTARAERMQRKEEGGGVGMCVHVHMRACICVKLGTILEHMHKFFPFD